MNSTPEFEYLLSGRTPRGRRVTEIVEAESADRAVQTFEAEGHTDVVLHTDDVAAPFSKPSESARVLSLREQLAVRTMGEGRRFLFHVWRGYRSLWHVNLIALAAIGLWLVVGQSAMGFAWLAVAVLLFTPVLQVYLSVFGPGAVYLRLLRAVGHAQWDRALELVPKVRLPLAPFELSMLKARALAGLDRLPEALAELDRMTGDPRFLRHVYWLTQSIVYLDGRDLERSLDALEQAHELAPGMTLITISLATRLLTVRRDTRRARELLAEVRRHAVADTAWPLLLHAEGVLALQEGRASEAVEPLVEAVRRQQPFLRMNPSILISGARMRANLCLALAATGDTAAARAELRLAAPLLAAHRDFDLLKRCEQAVG
jgi:hypothetical protein